MVCSTFDLAPDQIGLIFSAQYLVKLLKPPAIRGPGQEYSPNKDRGHHHSSDVHILAMPCRKEDRNSQALGS